MSSPSDHHRLCGCRQRGSEGGTAAADSSAATASAAGAAAGGPPLVSVGGAAPGRGDAREEERRALSQMGFEAGPRPAFTDGHDSR